MLRDHRCRYAIQEAVNPSGAHIESACRDAWGAARPTGIIAWGTVPSRSVTSETLNTMAWVYTYIAFIGVVTVIAVAVVIKLALRHRTRFSTSHALKNLRRELKSRQRAGRHSIPDAHAGLDQPLDTALSTAEIESTIKLITVLNNNTATLAKAAKLGMYSLIGTFALGAASFSPNTLPTRLSIVGGTILCALVFLLAGLRRIIRTGRANANLTTEFERWAEQHPNYGESPARSRASRRPRRTSEAAQQPW